MKSSLNVLRAFDLAEGGSSLSDVASYFGVALSTVTRRLSAADPARYAKIQRGRGPKPTTSVEKLQRWAAALIEGAPTSKAAKAWAGITAHESNRYARLLRPLVERIAPRDGWEERAEANWQSVPILARFDGAPILVLGGTND